MPPLFRRGGLHYWATLFNHLLLVVVIEQKAVLLDVELLGLGCHPLNAGKCRLCPQERFLAVRLPELVLNLNKMLVVVLPRSSSYATT